MSYELLNEAEIASISLCTNAELRTLWHRVRGCVMYERMRFLIGGGAPADNEERDWQLVYREMKKRFIK